MTLNRVLNVLKDIKPRGILAAAEIHFDRTELLVVCRELVAASAVTTA